MNKRLGYILAATVATSMTTALTAVPAFAQDSTVTFSVTNFTDLHGHISNGIKDPAEAGNEMGAARLQALVKAVNKDQDYALTTSGDNVGGSAYVSAISQDEYTMDALNAMGVVASATGNHEFDKGTEDLTGRITESSEFPILGANVLKDGKPLLKASVVKEINGVKVGFVGSVTKNTEAKVAPSLIPGVTFTDPVEATNTEAKRLKESGEAQVVVALFHEDAEKYASQFGDDVDVLFGGDTHVQSIGKTERDCGVPLVWAQGYEYGKLLNDADITFDKTTGKVSKIVLTQYDATDAAALTDDEAVAKIVSDAEAKAEELGKAIVGKLDQALYRGSDEGKDSGSNRGVESTLNNFIADGQRYAMAKTTGKTIDIAVMNAGGVRADLPAGDISYENIFTVQPFGNSVAYGTITGADFITALENQWQPGNSRPRLAMGVSNNVQVVYNQNGAQGARVQQVTVNGEVIDPAKEYTIALSTFLIGAGDGFFAEGVIKNVSDVGYMDTQTMIDYLASGEAKVRTGQGQIGVSVNGELAAGKEITVDLSSLNYTTEGEPMAKTVTVALGEDKQTVDIDNAKQESDDQYGERGRATVKFTLPEGFTGKENLVITTDAGTEATLNLANLKPAGERTAPEKPDEKKDDKSEEESATVVKTVTAEASQQCTDNGDDDKKPEEDVETSSVTSSGSSQGSSAAGWITGGLAVALITIGAGLAAFLGTAAQLLPAPIAKIIADLRAQLHI